MEEKKRLKLFTNFLFLHITVFIFALSLVANKMASNYLAVKGIWNKEFIVSMLCYGILTVLYAISWQINLEKYKLSFLYMNRAFYMVWSQIFAVIIFNNKLYIENIVGLCLIILGVWVNSRDV